MFRVPKTYWNQGWRIVRTVMACVFTCHRHKKNTTHWIWSTSLFSFYLHWLYNNKKPKKQSTTSFVSFSFLSQICWDQDFDAIRVYVIVGEGQRELTSISWLLLWLAWRREKVVGYWRDKAMSGLNKRKEDIGNGAHNSDVAIVGVVRSIASRGCCDVDKLMWVVLDERNKGRVISMR